MIFLGNHDFAVGMKLAGIKESYEIKNRDDIKKAVSGIQESEIIIANYSIAKLFPELKNYANLIVIPDSAKEFAGTDDLGELVKSVVGIELEVE
jgi:vacuolar-type H+-ATPase subunit F/Vma7